MCPRVSACCAVFVFPFVLSTPHSALTVSWLHSRNASRRWRLGFVRCLAGCRRRVHRCPVGHWSLLRVDRARTNIGAGATVWLASASWRLPVDSFLGPRPQQLRQGGHDLQQISRHHADRLPADRPIAIRGTMGEPTDHQFDFAIEAACNCKHALWTANRAMSVKQYCMLIGLLVQHRICSSASDPDESLKLSRRRSRI